MGMQPDRTRIYAILSIVFPIITVASVHILQTRAHSDFWVSVQNPEDSVQYIARIFMFLSEIGELVQYTTLACIVGLVLALRSIYLSRDLSTLGLFCLSLNATPLLLAAFPLIWGRG
jgi:hypothetical protein